MKSYPTPSPVIQPVVVTNAKPKIKTDLENQLNKLVEGMADLRVQVTNAPIKRNKPSNIRANVWCSNCKGYGHLSTECPSPIEGKDNSRPRCQFCGGTHLTSRCWNLASVREELQAIQQVMQVDSNRPWVNKTDPNKRPFTRPNVGPPYRPNDNRPRWNDTYNAPPVWNGPPTNPNTHRYGPPQPRKTVVCYSCGELGHYAHSCPNPRK